jgi:hypothetical protein
MNVAPSFGSELTSRELVRRLSSAQFDSATALPESLAWQAYLELKRRGQPEAGRLFVRAVRALHTRRCNVGSSLPTQDTHLDEHRLTEDPLLGDLWKAYKRCISAHRPGPADALLRDIEERVK